MRVFITEEGAEESARKLSSSDALILRAEELIRGVELLPEETEHLIFVVESWRGAITPVMQFYLERLLCERDNTSITYCAAVCTTTRRPYLTLYMMESLLYNAGLALPYSVILKDIKRVKAELEREEIEVQGRLPLSHFISRFLLRRGRREYKGVQTQ